MRDILAQGGDRGPRTWPRRLAVIGALLVVAVTVVLHLPRHRDDHAQPRRPASTASPVPSASGFAPSVAGVASEPAGVSGPTLPWESSVRLPVTGAQPLWFWPATGRTRRVAGLPRLGSGYQFTRVSGGWAVQAASGAQPAQGAPQPVYFLGSTAQSVTQVGLANGVAAGAAMGTLWLTSYPPDADPSTAAGTAREVSVTGAPLGPQLRLPAGYAIVQATERGLLLTPVTQQPGTTTYELWNPATPQASHPFHGVIAASASEIAWAPPCAPVCRVQVLDLTTGRRTAVELPGVSSAADGAFSPDGDYLAIEASFYNGGDAGALALQLDVASMSSGRLTAVPGTFVSSDALAGFGWPTASDTLISELTFTTKVQVAAWRPGAARLAVAAVRPGQTSDSLIVG
jgi:hypothetical protein